jgi:autotransporter-associated beta strand protein
MVDGRTGSLLPWPDRSTLTVRSRPPSLTVADSEKDIMQGTGTGTGRARGGSPLRACVVTLARLGAALALLTAGASDAPAQSAVWNPAATAGGSWGSAANWQGGTVPSGAGNTAGFALDFAAGASVTLDGDRAIGAVVSTGANPWTLAPGTGGTLTVANLTVTGGTVTVDAPLGGVDLTKGGGGTVVLTNSGNTYSGVVDINAGTLSLVGAANYSTASIRVHVASGAALDATGLTAGPRYGGVPSLRLNVTNGDTLDGTGTVTGGLRVSNGGTVYPGDNGVGALTVIGAGDFKSGSTWKVKLGTATPGGTNMSNRIDFSDALNVDDATAIPIDGSGLTFAAGQTYDYVIATSGTADFTLGAVAFLPTNFDPSAGVTPSSFSLITSGNDLVLRFTPVPEPAHVTAAGFAAVAGCGLLRRRRARRKEVR